MAKNCLTQLANSRTDADRVPAEAGPCSEMHLFSRLIHGCAWIAAALFVAAGGMLTYEVTARYFFTRPTIWAAELSQLCLIWGTLLAMAWALQARRHIAVDAVFKLLSSQAKRMAEGFSMMVIAIFSAVVIWKGGEIFWDSFMRGRTTGSMLDVPSWIAEFAVPVGFTLLFVQALIDIFRLLAGSKVDTMDHFE